MVLHQSRALSVEVVADTGRVISHAGSLVVQGLCDKLGLTDAKGARLIVIGRGRRVQLDGPLTERTRCTLVRLLIYHEYVDHPLPINAAHRYAEQRLTESGRVDGERWGREAIKSIEERHAQEEVG